MELTFVDSFLNILNFAYSHTILWGILAFISFFINLGAIDVIETAEQVKTNSTLAASTFKNSMLRSTYVLKVAFTVLFLAGVLLHIMSN